MPMTMPKPLTFVDLAINVLEASAAGVLDTYALWFARRLQR